MAETTNPLLTERFAEALTFAHEVHNRVGQASVIDAVSAIHEPDDDMSGDDRPTWRPASDRLDSRSVVSR